MRSLCGLSEDFPGALAPGIIVKSLNWILHPYYTHTAFIPLCNTT